MKVVGIFTDNRFHTFDVETVIGSRFVVNGIRPTRFIIPLEATTKEKNYLEQYTRNT